MRDPGRIAGPLVIPNSVLVRLAWSLPSGKVVYNTFHGSVAGAFNATSTIAEAVFTALKAAAGWTSWKANVNSGISMTGIDIKDLRTANQPFVSSSSAASAGTAIGVALPPGVALVVTLRTALAGISNRGRVYLTGIDSTALAAGGVAAAGTVTNSASFVSAVQAAMSGQGITLAIANPARQSYTGRSGFVHPSRGAGLVPVTTITTRNNVLDSQRRRKTGR